MNAPAPSALRQPLVWLVIALPLLSVVAGVSMLFLPGDSIDAVGDKVKRTAQVQEADLSRDVEAQRLALSATLRRAGDAIHVEGVGFDRNVPLQLLLRHPVRESEDRRATLARGVAQLPSFDATHDWIVELGPTDHRWRIVGRWKAHARETTLRPALGPAQ